MILLDFLGPYPPPVNYLFGKPLHCALLDTKTHTSPVSQQMVNNWLKALKSIAGSVKE